MNIRKIIKETMESIFPMDSPVNLDKKEVHPSYNNINSEDFFQEEENVQEESNIFTGTKKRIMIDFDGVIHSYHKGFQDGSIYGYLLEGSKEVIDKLKENGYEIIIYTSRVSPSLNHFSKTKIEQIKNDISSWLDKNEIYYDKITSEKLPAKIYIDDNAIRFHNWKKTSLLLKNYGVKL